MREGAEMQTRGAVKAAAAAERAKALRLLWRACQERDLKKLKAVLREHAAELEGALDTQDLEQEGQHTALTFAAFRNFPAGVEVLLKAGASVDKKIRQGMTALCSASFHGHDEVVALLLKFGASVNQTRDEGATALYLAAQEGKSKVIEVLIEHGADVDLAYEDSTPLFIASQQGRTTIVALLLKHRANVDLAMNDGVTPLIIASQNSHLPVMKLLLEHKANLHAVNIQGCNALHLAAFDDQPEACLLLISYGLDPATTINFGWSALSHYGCRLDGNASEDEDEDDPSTRPELSPETKAERRALLAAAREAFLLQQRRDANWKRRFPFLDALVGSQLRATAAVAAQQKLEQAAVDTSVTLPAVPRETKEENRDYLHGAIFGSEGFVRKIAEYL